VVSLFLFLILVSFFVYHAGWAFYPWLLRLLSLRGILPHFAGRHLGVGLFRVEADISHPSINISLQTCRNALRFAFAWWRAALLPIAHVLCRCGFTIAFFFCSRRGDLIALLLTNHHRHGAIRWLLC